MTSLPISFIGDFYGISWIHWQYYWRLTNWYPWCLSCQYHWWLWCHLLDNLIANNIDFLFDLLDDFVVNDHWWLWCDLLGDFVGKIIVDFVIYFLDNFGRDSGNVYPVTFVSCVKYQPYSKFQSGGQIIDLSPLDLEMFRRAWNNGGKVLIMNQLYS